MVDGHDAVLLAYGPVMLNEAIVAAETLQEQNLSLKVINLPWLNRIDSDWFEENVADCETVFVLDNHSQFGGLGDQVLNTAQKSDGLRSKKYIKFALNEYPACGTPPEVLAYHQLDGKSIAASILKRCGETNIGWKAGKLEGCCIHFKHFKLPAYSKIIKFVSTM